MRAGAGASALFAGCLRPFARFGAVEGGGGSGSGCRRIRALCRICRMPLLSRSFLDLILQNLSNALAKALILGSYLAEFVECPLIARVSEKQK